MTLSAKWRNRAAERTTPERDCIANIDNIATIPQTRTGGGHSGDYGDYGDRFSPPVVSTDGRTEGLPWPEPEPFPLVVRSEPWKYACLFAIASVYGAGLTKDHGGGLTLICPDTMPQEAAQAARDGLAELAGYIGARLQ